MTLRVIGAGFGRTGTASLKEALEALGFGKCYHMIELFQRPADARVWRAAYHGQPVDWDALFAGYQATVDWPGCTFYRELMERYPDAKVVLTVRDPEQWHASAMNTIYGAPRAFPLPLLRPLIPWMRDIFRMQDDLFWNGAFHGRFADKQYAIEVFNRHNAEVKRVVPPERLLVYEVKAGWAPLCRFLDVPVPVDRPFPHVNDGAEFRERIMRRVRLMRLGLGAVLAVGGLAVVGWRLRGR